METPQYQILVNNIKKDILTDILKDGDLLQSENELCRVYNITRSTVRKALDILVNEGYIEKRQGKGSIVNMKRNSLGLLSFRGFSDVMRKMKMNINSVTLQDPSIIKWPSNFFYPLSEEEMKTDCIFFNRLRLVNDEPVMLEYTYLPGKGLDKFLDNELVENSLFATLRQRYQVEVNNVYQDIRAKSADPKVAELLNTITGAPILHIYRRYFTNRENFRIYSSLYCNTDKFFITNEFE